MLHIQDQSHLQLAGAVLLYKELGPRQRDTFTRCTLHEVNKDGQIQPGRLATAESLTDVLLALKGETACGFEILHPRKLVSSARFNAWWSPERVLMTHFRPEMNIASGVMRHPPMLWIATDGNLKVWALPTNERPVMDTALCQPIQLNVWESAQVCTGSMATPPMGDIDAWEASFNGSLYTHTNSGPTWQTSHPKGTVGLWRELAEQKGSQPFPYQYLVPAGVTVAQVLNKEIR